MARRTGVARAVPLWAGVTVLAAGLAVVAQQPGVTTAPGAKTATPTTGGMDTTRQRVPITTADGVELDGTYFRGKAGRDTPVVMMVHKYGADRSKSDWIGLAQALQAKGFAVLTFDLRGHGQSQQLSNPQQFWSLLFNRNGIRGGGPKKTSISSNDFKPSYFPFIVNDLLAARRFLELKNDAGELNIHSLIILGAQEGAGLGFLFTATEYARTYNVGQAVYQSAGTRFLAGEDIAAGVWLSLSQRPGMPAGGPSFDIPNWLKQFPLIRDKTPMCFIYGEKDNRSKSDSEAIYRLMTGPQTGGATKTRLDVNHPIRGTDLAGPALLGQPALNVSALIVGFIEKVMTERRAIPWAEVKPETNNTGLVNLGPFNIRLP